MEARMHMPSGCERTQNIVVVSDFINLNSAKNYNEANDFRLNLP